MAARGENSLQEATPTLRPIEVAPIALECSSLILG
jgi:hypothetical protein